MAILTPEGMRAGRGLLKWSTRDLATRSGVAWTTINKIENGRGFRTSTADRIIAAFDANNVELANGDTPGARMADRWWAAFCGATRSFAMLQKLISDLRRRDEGEYIFLSRPGLNLGERPEARREVLAAFKEDLNAVLTLEAPSASPIEEVGSVYREGVDGRRGYVVLTGAEAYALASTPIVLQALGSTQKRIGRPIAERVAELRRRSEEFRRATNIFATAGEDFRELYCVMEAIIEGHRGSPKKTKKAAQVDFLNSTHFPKEQWEGLFRSARPVRHAYLHEGEDGVTYKPVQARAAIHHALKLWLECEVPA